VLNLPVSIRVEPVNLTKASNAITFTIQALDAPELKRTEQGRFIGPVG
jgi:hypothetical protein